MQTRNQEPPYFENCTIPFLRIGTDALRNLIPSYVSMTAFYVNTKHAYHPNEALRKKGKGLKGLRLKHGYKFSRLIRLRSAIDASYKTVRDVSMIGFSENQARELEEEILTVFQEEINPNGMWNCYEYAFYTWLMINKYKLLRGGFQAHIASLNDQKIPTIQYYNHFKNRDGSLSIQIEENHDHVFVIITDEYGRIVYVVDSWLSQIFPTQKTFIGSLKHFVEHLAKNKDGYYVREGFKAEHIRLITEELSQELLGNSRYYV